MAIVGARPLDAVVVTRMPAPSGRVIAEEARYPEGQVSSWDSGVIAFLERRAVIRTVRRSARIRRHDRSKPFDRAVPGGDQCALVAAARVRDLLQMHPWFARPQRECLRAVSGEAQGP